MPDAVKIASTDFAEAHHSTRTKARKQALDVLFQADLRNEAVHRTMARRTEQGSPRYGTSPDRSSTAIRSTATRSTSTSIGP